MNFVFVLLCSVSTFSVAPMIFIGNLFNSLACFLDKICGWHCCCFYSCKTCTGYCDLACSTVARFAYIPHFDVHITFLSPNEFHKSKLTSHSLPFPANSGRRFFPLSPLFTNLYRKHYKYNVIYANFEGLKISFKQNCCVQNAVERWDSWEHKCLKSALRLKKC